MTRPCRTCKKELAVHLFSPSQWNKPDATQSTCKECALAHYNYKSGEVSRICLDCNQSMVSTQYSYAQWLKGKFKSRCRACTADEVAYYNEGSGRQCAKCTIHCESSDYTMHEWKKGEGSSQCKRCGGGKEKQLCQSCGTTIQHCESQNCSACLVAQNGAATERACSTCRRVFDSKGYSSSQWNVTGDISECLACEGETTAYQRNSPRDCYSCGRSLHAAMDYSLSEWHKGENNAKCRKCVIQQGSETTTSSEAVEESSRSLHKNMAATRICACCKKGLKLKAFSKPQLKLKQAESCCKECVKRAISKSS